MSSVCKNRLLRVGGIPDQRSGDFDPLIIDGISVSPSDLLSVDGFRTVRGPCIL